MQKKHLKDCKDRRIVVLGKTGSGKSASGNTILGRDAFTESSGYESVSHTCQKESGEVAGRQITVIDTPGLSDTTMTQTDLRREIQNCVTLSLPGPHVFLLVIRLDVRFTEEERDAVRWIQENFGERAAQFTMVLFTHADPQHPQRLEQAVRHRGMTEIINRCEGGCHAFNNNSRDDPTQVNSLLRKIDALVVRNRGEYFTNQMYREAQRTIREEEMNREIMIRQSHGGTQEIQEQRGLEMQAGGISAGPRVGAEVQGAGVHAETRLGLGVHAGAGVGLGIRAGAEVGLGVHAGAGVGLGIRAGAEVGLGIRAGAEVGLGVHAGAGVGLGIRAGAEVGLGVHAGAEVGLGVHAGAGVGLGIRARAEVGLGIHAGAGVGLGIRAGAEVELGICAGAGGGLGVHAGAGVGLGVHAGAGLGLGIHAGAEVGVHAGEQVGLGVHVGVGEGLGVGIGNTAGVTASASRNRLCW